MQRRTPLRRTPFKRRAPKYPSAQALAERRAWGEANNRCHLCDRGEWDFMGGLQTHEICRRSQAPYRWCHVANFLRLCPRCHAKRVANITLAPYAAQLAVKLARDPECYDFAEFVRIVGRPVVAPEDVELCVRLLAMIGWR